MYQEIASNKRKSLFMIFLFVVFIMAVGYGVSYLYPESGYFAIGIAFFIAFISAFFSYYHSDKMALAASRAKKIDKKKDERFYRIMENLCISVGMEMPSLYIIEDLAINAFATGRDPKHASIAVTRGALERLDKVELEGVLAHELSHVRNYDIRVMAIVMVLVGTVAIVSDMMLRMTFYSRSGRNRGAHPIVFLVALVLLILAPICASLIKLAVSREREYLADASGSMITRYPEGLARALEKIRDDHDPLDAASKGTAHLYISSPLKDKHGRTRFMDRMFASHPPIGDRIRRLRKMV